MTAILAAVLAASLVGSLHCAGMCGPFLAFVVGAGPSAAGGPSALRLQVAYHAARGLGYALLGAAAGSASRVSVRRAAVPCRSTSAGGRSSDWPTRMLAGSSMRL